MALLDDIKARAALGREAAGILLTLGADTLEIDGLLGIGWAESKWDWKASGAAKERGFWQIELEDTAPETQCSNALRQWRELADTLSLYQKEKWYQALDLEPRGLLKLLRAAWQMGRRGPARALSDWLAGKDGKDKDDPRCVKTRWSKVALQGKKQAGESDDDARLRILTQGGRLGAVDFISYCVSTHGADRGALEQGQNVFRAFMEAVGWRPRDVIGEYRYGDSMPTATGETISGAEPSTWIGRQVKGLLEGVKEGTKVIFGDIGRYILPTALLVVGGGLAFNFLKRLWSSRK